MGATASIRLRAAALVALLFVVLGVASPAAAAQTTLSGIDVSHWQGQPVWRDVATDGVSFAIAKVSEGRGWRDSEYARNKSRAEAKGIAFTGYHFARPDRTAGDAIAEADNFVDGAALTKSNLLPVLDLEDGGGLSRRKLRRWVKAWLARVEQRLGVKPIIYVSPSFWVARMGDSRWFADHGYGLWIAHWYVDEPRVPAANWGGNGWTLWQHSSCGSVAGITGCVDLDRYALPTLGALRIKRNR